MEAPSRDPATTPSRAATIGGALVLFIVLMEVIFLQEQSALRIPLVHITVNASNLLIAAVLLWITRQVGKEDPRNHAWSILALAWCLLFLGDLVSAVVELGLGRSAFP